MSATPVTDSAVTDSAVISVEGVSKSYRRGPETVRALQGVDLHVAEGQLLGLVGPSGSGKTTLLNVLAGWEDPDAGTSYWRGEAVTAATLAGKGWDEIAVIPQGLGILDELTVEENIGLPVRLTRGEEARTDEMLEIMDLGAVADRGPQDLSLGERQRVSIARALVRLPRLVLADEPTGHQDAIWAGGVITVLRRFSSEYGTSCLVATHDEEVLGVLDRVVTLEDGRLAH